MGFRVSERSPTRLWREDAEPSAARDMGKKYRSRGVKREHNIIQGLLPILERIAAYPDVDSVIPGRIKVTSTTISVVKLRVQTRTISGLKLGARSRRASQEVFVVTSKPDAVVSFLLEQISEMEEQAQRV